MSEKLRAVPDPARERERAPEPPRSPRAQLVAHVQWIARACSWFVFRADIQVAEVVATIDCLWWILMMLKPGNLFDSNMAFTTMRVVFDEWQWLLISMSILVLPLGALALRGDVRLRRASLLAWVWYYAVIAWGVTQSSGVTTGTGVYGTLSLASAWGYWRLGVRRRV